MTILFVLLIVFLLAKTIVGRSDLFYPGRIYILIYSFYLSVNFLKLSRLQLDWPVSTHLVFWGSSFLFLAGTAVGDLVSLESVSPRRIQDSTMLEQV
jgi:hypothetical protein